MVLSPGPKRVTFAAGRHSLTFDPSGVKEDKELNSLITDTLINNLKQESLINKKGLCLAVALLTLTNHNSNTISDILNSWSSTTLNQYEQGWHHFYLFLDDENQNMELFNNSSQLITLLY
jgi:hypothetical protein